MIAKNKKLFYTISILFVIISIYLFIVSNETKTNTIAFLCLLFFGGGSIVRYTLENKESGNLVKNITGILGCFIFVIVSYFMLPFNHLFDDTKRYNSTLGWIIGIVGILFFGFGFFKLILKLFKENFRK